MRDDSARDLPKNAFLEPDVRAAFPTDDEVNEALRMLMGLSELGVEGEVTLSKFSGLLDSLGEQTQENTTNMEELKADSAELQRRIEQLTVEANAALELLNEGRPSRRDFKTHD